MLNVALALLLTSFELQPNEVQIDAERLLHDGANRRTTAEGQASLRGDGYAINADRILFDRSLNAVTAIGHVVARIAQNGLVVMTGDVVTLRMAGNQVREVFMHEGRAVTKSGVSKEGLLSAKTAEVALRLGTNVALLEGNHLKRNGPVWTAEKISLVPCDCDLSKPSWSIVSSNATVDTQSQRVEVVSPVVFVHHVPIFWFPWLSFPLKSRDSGFLTPQPGYSPLGGFLLNLPLYLTLGRSADLTLTPGFQTGPFTNVFGAASGMAGPRLTGEFRYTPARETSGQLFVGVVNDFRPKRDPVNPSLLLPIERGLRGEISWTHTSDFRGGDGVRVDARAHSDGYYLGDGTSGVMAREAGYLRSSAVALLRRAGGMLSVDTVLRQDLIAGYDWFGQAPRPANSTAPLYGPGTLARLPGVSWLWPLQNLIGPLSGEIQAEYVRLAPLFSNTGDEGGAANEGWGWNDNTTVPFECIRIGMYTPTVPSDAALAQCEIDRSQKRGIGDRQFQLGEREARNRFRLAPKVLVSATPADVFAVDATLSWQQSLWVGEATGRTFVRGYPVLGARVSTEVARQFESSKLRHLMIPFVELRSIPAMFRWASDSNAVFVPYDEIDAAPGFMSDRSFSPVVQLVAELRQRLWAARSGPSVRIDLGQNVDVLSPHRPSSRLGESYARLILRWWWLYAYGTLRVDSKTTRLTQLSAGLSVNDGRGHNVAFDYENVQDDGTGRSRRPVDLLFGSLVANGSTSYLAKTEAAWALGPVRLSYRAIFTERLWPTEITTEFERRFSFAEHALGVAYTPNCDCWSVQLSMAQRPDPNPIEKGRLLAPEMHLGFEVRGFGRIGM